MQSMNLFGNPENKNESTIQSTSQRKIPEGGIYYQRVLPKNVGQYVPGKAPVTDYFPEEPDNDSVFVHGDYEYRFNKAIFGLLGNWSSASNQDGWGVRVLDTTKAEYGEILEEINGKPVKNMDFTFSGCSNLKVSPKIPSNVEHMRSTYKGCTSLETAPEIPPGVIGTLSTFRGCNHLTGTLTINANPEQYDDCLNEVSTASEASLKLNGSSRLLNEILNTKSDNSNIVLE